MWWLLFPSPLPPSALTSPVLPNPLLLAGFLITKLGVGAGGGSGMGAGQGRRVGHVSVCSETSHPTGSEAGLGCSPQLPYVGGLPGPTAVNRQPYDLVLVCVRVWAWAGWARAEQRMSGRCGTCFRRMVSRWCILFSVSPCVQLRWPLVSGLIGDSLLLSPPSPHRSSAPSHSMSSRRDTDSDTQDANDSSCKSSERSLPDCTPHPNSISIDAGPRQAPKIAQIKRNLSYGDNSDPALEASSLPPPDPWLETSSSSPAEPAQPGACRRDGYWFLKLLQAETERLEGWCCQMDKETKENNLSEEGGSCKGIWCHTSPGAFQGSWAVL